MWSGLKGLRPLVFGGCLDQVASGGWELCLQATLMGTGLVARFACFSFFRFSVSLLLLCRASVRAVCMPSKMLQSSLQTSC